MRDRLSAWACAWCVVAIAVILLGTSASPSQAQSLLCPSSFGPETNFQLSGGYCTNGRIGAFSGAALATQALSTLSQSATQETARTTSNALTSRREQEQARCPDGFSRVNGTCEPNVRPAPAVVSAPEAAPVRLRRGRGKTARVVRPVRSRVVAAPALPVFAAPAPIYQSHFGAWAQGYGSYEDRTVPVALDGQNPALLSTGASSTSSTIGFLGGIDYTSRNLGLPDDGLVLGILTGYLSSDYRIKTTTFSKQVNRLDATTDAKIGLSGPSAGVYGIYFAGPFTADLTFKADILDLKDNFVENLGFPLNGITLPFSPTAVATYSASGSGGLTNLSTFGNLSYRLFSTGPVWIEPTIGFQYIDSLYDNKAKQLFGFDDGYLLMVQGGARIGNTYVLPNNSVLTTTLTGLAYDDVRVRGGFIPGAGFQSNLFSQSDEGKARGRGILTVNYDLTNGTSLYAQGEVYGGDNLFGAGGKGGIRVRW